MVVTEIALIPLVPGLDLRSGETRDSMKHMVDTISSQEGCRSLYWGTQRENPDMLELAIEWSSVDDHKRFMQSKAYAPFMDGVKSLITDRPTLRHYDMVSTELPTFPITEAITLYFASSFDGSEMKDRVKQLNDACAPKAEGFRGLVGGMCLDEVVEHEKLEGGKGKCARLFIGWDDYEAHMKFRETPTLAEVQPILRKETKHIEMNHVVYEKY